jgi:hypothetical protein
VRQRDPERESERGFILDSTGCVCTAGANDVGRKAQEPKVEYHSGRLNVFYPDARLEPRKCQRTGMMREFCPCAPCRARRRRKHKASCSCYLCFSDRMGELIDNLGRLTTAGGWLWFVTVTFRTPSFPWIRGFPIEQPQPSPDFVHHFFDWMIRWIEREVHHRVEFFRADQYGEIGGRIHLHCGLSWPGLFEYRWKHLQKMLCEKAGWNKILPWEKDAGYYLGRYIGRDAHRANWDWRVGNQSAPARPHLPVGRTATVLSRTPDEASSSSYRQNLRSWHR